MKAMEPEVPSLMLEPQYPSLNFEIEIAGPPL